MRRPDRIEINGLRAFAAAAALVMLVPIGAAATVPDRAPPIDDRETATLTGWLLVASPGMSDPRFAGTVVLIVRHDSGGALGLVINRAVGTRPVAKLVEGAGEAEPGDGNDTIRVHYGGPVEPRRGFVLHSSEFAIDGTVAVTGAVSMTANPAILRRIAAGKGPRRRFIVMGYAGWAAGQIEAEIERDDWVTVTSDERIVFDGDMRTKWRRAMDKRGLEL